MPWLTELCKLHHTSFQKKYTQNLKWSLVLFSFFFALFSLNIRILSLAIWNYFNQFSKFTLTIFLNSENKNYWQTISLDCSQTSPLTKKDKVHSNATYNKCLSLVWGGLLFQRDQAAHRRQKTNFKNKWCKPMWTNVFIQASALSLPCMITVSYLMRGEVGHGHADVKEQAHNSDCWNVTFMCSGFYRRNHHFLKLPENHWLA